MTDRLGLTRHLVDAETAIALMSGAPRLDAAQLRRDLDELIDQDPHLSIDDGSRCAEPDSIEMPGPPRRDV